MYIVYYVRARASDQLKRKALARRQSESRGGLHPERQKLIALSTGRHRFENNRLIVMALLHEMFCRARPQKTLSGTCCRRPSFTFLQSSNPSYRVRRAHEADSATSCTSFYDYVYQPAHES